MDDSQHKGLSLSELRRQRARAAFAARFQNGGTKLEPFVLTPPAPPTTKKKPAVKKEAPAPAKTPEQRIAEATQQAMDAYNEILAKPCGLQRAVSMANRKWVGRAGTMRAIKEVCQSLYGTSTVPAKFWEQYFQECANDDFLSGRTGGGRDHPNWKPDFEFLTREATIVKVYERAVTRG